VLNALKVGYSVLRYRGGIGQWAWAVNRVAGVGVLLFLALHIFDIFLVAFPALFEELLIIYKGPIPRVLEVFLVFGLLYHGVNGLRLILMDFKPTTARHHIKLFYIQLAIFLILFIPVSVFMLQEWFSAIGGGIITIGLLALPLVIAGIATYAPLGAVNAQVSGGNYQDALARLASSRGKPRSGFEFYMWLFMRVSGLLLIVIALFHVFWMHIIIGVEQINFWTIVERWTGPEGAFWRLYDLLLLAFAFTHGANGTRNVIDDYVHAPGWRAFIRIALIVFWFVLMGMGAFIIFTFTPGMIGE
jgi:succinate dehydrogenase cytochrome b556 subunit